VFLAWAGPDAVDEWLDRLGPDATEDDKGRLRAALAVIRRRGYALNLEAVANLTLSRALSGRGAPADHRRQALAVAVEELAHEEYLLQELEAGATYRLSQVSAPVFGADGAVALALTVVGLPEKLSGEEIPRYGDALVSAARRVTASIHGRPPSERPVVSAPS
jgi:DNA-binding IclR family transcriptional regulator